MSHAYAYYRDMYMKGMLRRFIYFSCFMYYAGAVSYYVTFHALGDSVNEQGKT